MNDILLDTNSFIWWTSNYKKLSLEAYQAIASEERKVYVSAVTGIEIAIKQLIQKINYPHNVEEIVESYNFIELPIYNRHVKLLSALPLIHKDPFDRILIAQALSEGLTLVTSDSEIIKYNVPAIRT